MLFSSSLYNVMTREDVDLSGNKDVLVNLRLRPDVRLEFKAVAELRGATMSGLLHQFIVKAIREERERDPVSFNKLVGVIRMTTE